MMNNLQCTLAVLKVHMDARQWDPNAVAPDLLDQLGLDPEADAKNCKLLPAFEESQVAKLEDAAEAAVQKAREARDVAVAARTKLNAELRETDPTIEPPPQVVLPPPAVPPAPFVQPAPLFPPTPLVQPERFVPPTPLVQPAPFPQPAPAVPVSEKP